ncbi:MAG: polysaccharide biosynthesis protein, partial [Flavobacteriales bacterium]
MNFFTKNTTPRWLIFILDVGICLCSLTLAYLLRFNFAIPHQEILLFPVAYATVIGVRILTFIAFRTFAGIIRFTSTEDALRIFIAVGSGSLLLAAFGLARFFFIDAKYILPFSVLIIELMTTTFLMISYRIGVKILYMEINNPSRLKKGVIIYGAGVAGVTTKRSIERDAGSKLKVVAFIDDSKGKRGKKVENVPIYSPAEMEKLVQKYAPSNLIISTRHIRQDRKRAIIEQCLRLNLNVLNVPPVKDWINGELSFKQIKRVRIEDLLGRDVIELDSDKIEDDLKNKCILITGAAGSIGSELARQLSGFNVRKLVLFDIAESALYELQGELQINSMQIPFEIVIGDVRRKERMENVFKTFKPDIVFHAAAYKHVPMMEANPSEGVLTNVDGTRITADLSIAHKVEKFVFISTDKAVNPTSVMGATKRIAEMYVQSLNGECEVQFITTRFGNVLGSNGSVIPLFRKQIEKGGPVMVTHPEITRFFMTIPEACQLVLQAATMGKGGEIFVFDMGEAVKIVDLAEKMIKLSGLESGRDIQIVFTGLRPGEKLYEEVLADKENT